MIKMYPKTGFALLLLALSACDTLYHSQQMAQRNACEKLPNPQDMRACLQNISGNYERYQKQREVLKSEPAQAPFEGTKTPDS